MVDKRIIAERRKAILALADRYGVYDVRVFGSVARGDACDESDIDLLVKVRQGRSLFDLGGFLMDVQDLLGCKVDVLTDDGLKPRIRERVLREAVAV